MPRPKTTAIPAIAVRFMAISLSTERYRWTISPRSVERLRMEAVLQATNTAPEASQYVAHARASRYWAEGVPLPMFRLSLARSILAASLIVAPGALVACAPFPGADGPSRPLPAYAGHATELFDDVIEPAAVGISLDVGADLHSDRRLRERTQVADATVRMRVTTVTAKQEESGTRYIIGMRMLEKLTGQFPPGDTFEIIVGRSSPAVAILKGLDMQLVGKTFVGFLRAFVRPDGDQELHFHLAPDTKAEVGAVKDAVALGEL